MRNMVIFWYKLVQIAKVVTNSRVKLVRHVPRCYTYLLVVVLPYMLNLSGFNFAGKSQIRRFIYHKLDVILSSYDLTALVYVLLLRLRLTISRLLSMHFVLCRFLRILEDMSFLSFLRILILLEEPPHVTTDL